MQVVPRSALPTQRSFSAGISITPSTGVRSYNSAISDPNVGFPVIKLLVPSIGSTTHDQGDSVSLEPNSSPIKPCAG
ncbi:uncharacterized protein METZ01_LOCUS47435 [marine metagenome]|uniref:Uncharacterized protein n=1 Tax=marine metagenome TaxID=408172 RepID=A0A381RTV8_9ZZZZ